MHGLHLLEASNTDSTPFLSARWFQEHLDFYEVQVFGWGQNETNYAHGGCWVGGDLPPSPLLLCLFGTPRFWLEGNAVLSLWWAGFLERSQVCGAELYLFLPAPHKRKTRTGGCVWAL